VAIACSGLSAPKMAVPATITLLPASCIQHRSGAMNSGVGGLTGLCADADGLGADTAIDLDVLIGKSSSELSHFGHTPIHEFLPAET
jgi:hypothetical protein